MCVCATVGALVEVSHRAAVRPCSPFSQCILGWSTGHQVWPLNPFTSRLPPHLSLNWNAITSMIWSCPGRQPTPTLFLSTFKGFFIYLFFQWWNSFLKWSCHRSGAIIHKQSWGFQALPTHSIPLLQVLGIPSGSRPSLAISAMPSNLELVSSCL